MKIVVRRIKDVPFLSPEKNKGDELREAFGKLKKGQVLEISDKKVPLDKFQNRIHTFMYTSFGSGKYSVRKNGKSLFVLKK